MRTLLILNLIFLLGIVTSHLIDQKRDADISQGIRDEQQLVSNLTTKEVEQTDFGNESSKVSNATNNVCLTKGCIEIAARIIKNMDETFDPCQDFYNFSCGSYVKRTTIPDEKSSVDAFSNINDDLRIKLRLILEKEFESNETMSIAMSKNLYKSCMNKKLIQELGLQPLRTLLNEIGGWPSVLGDSWNESNFPIVEALKKIHKDGFASGSIISIGVQVDFKNSSQRSILVDQPTLGLKREYLMKGVNDSDIKAYLKYSTSVAILLGANPETARKEMMESLLFEMQLAKISTPRENRRDFTKMHNILSIHKLQEISPQIHWLDIIRTILPPYVQINANESIILVEPNYFKSFTNLIDKVEKRTIANYLSWMVAKGVVKYLSEDIRDLEFQYKKKLGGQSSRVPRWKECVDLVQESLPIGMGNLYVKNYFNEEAKTQMNMLVKYVRSSFDHILKAVDWMDEVTRANAIEKSKAIQAHIAYPKELLMESMVDEFHKNLTINAFSLLDNLLRVNIFYSNYNNGLLSQNVDKSDWKQQASVAVVNAMYYPSENSIKFPAGILQGIFFEPNYPNYVNFAGIGFVIGHEITHGFDDEGKQFDGEGNLKNWWQAKAEKRFHEKAQCIIDQYSNYTSPENGLQLNGINTQGEDIADNGGIKEAYMAYQQWVKDHGSEQTLPGLPYSINQLFWISAAQKHCEKSRPEYSKIIVMTGSHTPMRFRLIGPISNSPDFANDFKCPLGSEMNPIKKCSVW